MGLAYFRFSAALLYQQLGHRSKHEGQVPLEHDGRPAAFLGGLHGGTIHQLAHHEALRRLPILDKWYIVISHFILVNIYTIFGCDFNHQIMLRCFIKEINVVRDLLQTAATDKGINYYSDELGSLL